MHYSTLDPSPRQLAGDHPRTASRAAMALAVATFAAGFCQPTPAEAGHRAAIGAISNGDRPISALTVGEDLFVTIDDPTPGLQYRVTLVDEISAVIAEQVSATSIRAAKAGDDGDKIDAMAPLWFRSGVIGCDPGTVSDPNRYTYRTFDEAEALLDGRRFAVEVREHATGILVDRQELPVHRDPLRRFYYFADGTGCPRSELRETEALYLAASGLGGDGLDLVVFIIGGGFPPWTGEELDDVRSKEYPGYQTIPVATGQQKLLELVWTNTRPGKYGGVVRVGVDTWPAFKSTDTWVGAMQDGSDFSRISPHGITVVPWDCPGCPDDQTLSSPR